MGSREREIKRRLRVLEHAEKIGNVRMTCRYFGLAPSTFYRWKTEYDKHGEAGLGRKSTAARNHPRRVPAEIVVKLVHLRRKYHLGPIRRVWMSSIGRFLPIVFLSNDYPLIDKKQTVTKCTFQRCDLPESASSGRSLPAFVSDLT